MKPEFVVAPQFVIAGSDPQFRVCVALDPGSSPG